MKRGDKVSGADEVTLKAIERHAHDQADWLYARSRAEIRFGLIVIAFLALILWRVW